MAGGWRRISQAARVLTGAAPIDGVTWPVALRGTSVGGISLELRALRLSDEGTFHAVRRANAAWLEPWDATSPADDGPPLTFAALVARYDEDARRGRALPFVITVDGQLVGQLNVSNIVLGSFRSCTVGYWVSRAVAGLGVAPTALALAGDFAFEHRRLHRIEVNIRPENAASIAVVRKLGFRDEGERQRYLHIDGAWRDHRSYAVTVEDLAGERLIDRLARLGNSHSSQA